MRASGSVSLVRRWKLGVVATCALVGASMSGLLAPAVAMGTQVTRAPSRSGAPVITEFRVPTSGAEPLGIAAGPDGNLWFTEEQGGNIAKITPEGAITEYPVPDCFATCGPLGITAGPDGDLWFVLSFGDGAIGWITTQGAISDDDIFGVPTGLSGAEYITPGPDGNLWFTEDSAGNIGKITLEGSITEYPIPGGSRDNGPLDIVTGPDGDLWFTDTYDLDGYVWKMTTQGVFTDYRTCDEPGGITAGPGGALWYTCGSGIAKITPAGKITDYPLPVALTPLSEEPEVVSIATGPDGNLWFTDKGGNYVGKLTPQGVITGYRIPTKDAQLGDIAAGPDGDLWFTESGADKIGRITVGASKAGTTTVLKLSRAQVAAGHEQTETISVAVVQQFPGSEPSGSVRVLESNKTLCTIRLLPYPYYPAADDLDLSTGKGTCKMGASELKVGTFRLTAEYLGTTNFLPSSSTEETLKVTK